jgi:hypothetical protein
VSPDELEGGDRLEAVVKRLARPHPSGGYVVERAALLASGADFGALIAWIDDHAGVAEAISPQPARRGLHGARVGLSGGSEPRNPLRFVLPAGSLA